MDYLKERHYLGENVSGLLKEENEKALTKKLSQLCGEVSEKLKQIVDIYDKDEIIEQIQPEEFYSLIPKQFNNQLGLFAEGFNIAGKAWEKASSDDLEVEEELEDTE